ncbi:MAG: hypothetical protein GY714_13230 [Desulfobacterales bacterium]|nr:hypothetical protein [Desulfobacterales bacterium]
MFLLLGLPILDAVAKDFYPVWVFAGYVLFMGYLLLIFIRKSKDAKCPNCETDLYDIIDMAKNKGIKPSYCISCGQEIEI